jgi:hypothetical protein
MATIGPLKKVADGRDDDDEAIALFPRADVV